MPAMTVDPAWMRLWGLADGLARSLRTVHRITARAAPSWAASGESPGAHRHAVPTLVACLEGVVRIATARGHRDLGPGELAVLAPAAWHAHTALKPGSAVWMQGVMHGGSDLLLAEPGRELSLLLPAQPSVQLLTDLAAADDPARRLVLGRQLAAQVTRTPGVLREVHPAVRRMSHVLWYGLHRQLRAADILAAAGVGPRQAHRLFTAYFGLPPKQAILDQQLALAAELLHEGAGVAETAAACGFRDRRAFTRAWTSIHASPPSHRRHPG
jgi:AraC-like DNA-binding protein